jgi:poly-gamma-glutamate synthesis protein (capsule biosynthesis protein)
MAVMCAARASGAGDIVRVAFIGDIMAHSEQLEAASGDKGWNFAPQFRRVLPLFRGALVVGNLETVFAGEDPGYAGYPMFNTPDELASNLRDAGVRVVTLANNHILDRGEAGAARTIETLDSVGILWMGLEEKDQETNEPRVVDYGGLKWAFLNYSYGSNNSSSTNAASRDVSLNRISNATVAEGLARAKDENPDVTVVCFHWGMEYATSPAKSARTLAELCFKNGADMVIGTHPHVLQPIEIAETERGVGLVAYSLGNFVSYQRTRPRERSVVLAVDVRKKEGGGSEIARVSVAPTWVSSQKPGGRRRIEVVYSGTGGPFNHEGLQGGILKRARDTGARVLDFLGARATPDAEGFYTLWDETSGDLGPRPRRKTPD